LIGGWNIFFVSLGPRIFILKSIGGQIILNFYWLLKMRRPLIGGEDFELPLGKGNKLKERSWKLTKEQEGSFLGWGKEKKKKGMCGKKINSSYVWKGVVHERDVCTN